MKFGVAFGGILKKLDIVNSLEHFLVGLRKMLIFFASTDCKNHLTDSHHTGPISTFYKFQTDLISQG